MSLQAWNFGKPIFECLYCGSLLWYEEWLKKSQRQSSPTFSICCGEGKVRLPPMQPPPEFLGELLSHEGGLDHKNFKKTLELITPFLACLPQSSWQNVFACLVRAAFLDGLFFEAVQSSL